MQGDGLFVTSLNNLDDNENDEGKEEGQKL